MNKANHNTGTGAAARRLAAASLAAALGAGTACDSTAKFSIPDRKFNDIQVVTAFPALISDSGTITRVCGPALDNEVALTPNGVEMTVNFVSTQLKNPACDNDPDQSIKEGELIELSMLQASGSNSTVSPGNFKVDLKCVEPHGPGASASCPTGITSQGQQPSAVRYVNNGKRCEPSSPETWLNVAVLIDSSGSTTGFVDPVTKKEDSKAVPDGKLSSSDPGDARIIAVETFVKSLNAKDRVIAYHFGENLPDGVEVAASDDAACLGGANKGKICTSDAACPGGACVTGESPKGNTFKDLARVDAEQRAFGNGADKRAYLLNGIQAVKDEGTGRAPLWSALKVVSDSLVARTAGVPASRRHIVVLTDGPDTCAHSESLLYAGSDGFCRVPCQSAAVKFQELRAKLAEAKYPVTVHFIQWQAEGYKEPDAEMMELACRTGGTFQFLNFQEMNLSNLDALNKAMQRAIFRIRYALSGSWRVGLKLNAIQPPPEGQIATGQIYAAAGALLFQSQLFQSLKTPYEYSTNWKFGIDDGNEDRRLVLRRACAATADCKGTDACAANHCDAGGLCRSSSAPDKLPCSGGMCCAGVCAADCPTACK